MRIKISVVTFTYIHKIPECSIELDSNRDRQKCCHGKVFSISVHLCILNENILFLATCSKQFHSLLTYLQFDVINIFSICAKCLFNDYLADSCLPMDNFINHNKLSKLLRIYILFFESMMDLLFV